MTQEQIALELFKREVLGKSVKHVRAEGMVPAVIYDHGKDSVVVMGKYLDVLRVFQKAGKHSPVEIKLASKNYMALIKDIDFDPKKNTIQHIVFNAVAADQEVQAEVPITITGEIPASRIGLLIITPLDHVEVEALPRDLPEEVTVDGSNLSEVGDKLTVADIVPVPNVRIMSEAEHAIAVVEEPKAQIAEEAAEEEAEGEENAEESGEEAEGEESANKES